MFWGNIHSLCFCWWHLVFQSWLEFNCGLSLPRLLVEKVKNNRFFSWLSSIGLECLCTWWKVSVCVSVWGKAKWNLVKALCHLTVASYCSLVAFQYCYLLLPGSLAFHISVLRLFSLYYICSYWFSSCLVNILSKSQSACLSIRAVEREDMV